MRRVSITAWAWILLAYSYTATTLSAAWFARRFAAERGQTLDVPTSLLWQGATYAAWLPAVGLAWLVLRRWGSGPRGVVALCLAGLAVVPLEALAMSAIDGLFRGVPVLARAVGRLPVAILLYTAIVGISLAVAYARRAAEARARTRDLEAALAEARAALAEPSDPETAPGPERLMVMAGARRVPVEPAQVEWFGAADNYVVVHWQGREGLLRVTLQSLEARLDSRVFVRSHRSALVNLARVAEVRSLSDGSWRLTMESSAEVVTSRTYRDDLLRRLGR